MYKKLVLVLSIAITKPCAAMLENESLKLHCTAQRFQLETKLNRIELSLASLKTQSPNMQIIIKKSCIISRAQVIAQAQETKKKIATTDPTLARNFSAIITRAQRLSKE